MTEERISKKTQPGATSLPSGRNYTGQTSRRLLGTVTLFAGYAMARLVDVENVPQRGDLAGGIAAEAIRAVRLGEDAVDDHVHARVEAVLYGLPRGAVGRRELAVPARLVGHGGELGDGIRGAVRIGRARRAAARYDLDVVGAFLEQLAHL